MASLSFPPILAVTVKVIDQVSACSPMVTGVLATVIYVGFTVGPLPAITADTFV